MNEHEYICICFIFTYMYLYYMYTQTPNFFFKLRFAKMGISNTNNMMK